MTPMDTYYSIRILLGHTSPWWQASLSQAGQMAFSLSPAAPCGWPQPWGRRAPQRKPRWPCFSAFLPTVIVAVLGDPPSSRGGHRHSLREGVARGGLTVARARQPPYLGGTTPRCTQMKPQVWVGEVSCRWEGSMCCVPALETAHSLAAPPPRALGGGCSLFTPGLRPHTPGSRLGWTAPAPHVRMVGPAASKGLKGRRVPH